MTICSYLVQPEHGGQDHVLADLRALKGCEAVAATNGELIVLLTETADDLAERELHYALNQLPRISGMSLTFAHGLGDNGETT